MSTDIGLQTTTYQVGNRQWLKNRHGTDYTPNVTLDISLFSQNGTNEAQTVTITGTPTGGTFTLSYGGFTTTGLAYNSTAGAVQSALQALPSIGAGNVTVTGGPGPGTPYVATFVGTLAGRNIAQMTAAHVFTGGSSPAIAVTTTTSGATGHYRDGYIPSGCAIGKVTATGKYGPYDDGAGDGRQVLFGLTYADVQVIRQNGSVAANVGTGALVHGFVDQAKLPFQFGSGAVDANGKADNPLIRFE